LAEEEAGVDGCVVNLGTLHAVGEYSACNSKLRFSQDSGARAILRISEPLQATSALAGIVGLVGLNVPHFPVT
jgi:hypothetical protein